jgi:4-amino-4-deoxy-L-arabinose transferase-like glycosyltransferase
MTNFAPADQQHKSTVEHQRITRGITRATVMKVFAIIAVGTFVLRIFYAGHLYEDDGLWFTAAEEILRGKALYSGIYFDKPPALPLLYAGLFKVFGAHILTIRLFTIAYSIMVSAVIYKFGSWLYDKRAGLIAATMFTFFSTTAASGHTQGFDTDFLMVLPYTLGAYLLTRACLKGRAWLAVAGGAVAGVAVQVNPKGVFDLVFFAALLLAVWLRLHRARIGASEMWSKAGRTRLISLARLIGLALTGFVTGSLPFVFYLAATHSLSPYWLYVWVWGSRYVNYNSVLSIVTLGLRVNLGYFALNSTLLITLVVLVVSTIKRARRLSRNRESEKGDISNSNAASAPDTAARRVFESDVTLLIWLGVSFAGLSVGGRFYTHYFFQIMPALSLIGARGLSEIASFTRSHGKRTRQAVIVLLVIGFTSTVVRFHTRTVTLAADWVRGKKSEATVIWFHERLNHEERMIAAMVRDLPEAADAADSLGVEGIRRDTPRAREIEGSSDYLFVWGYRPEIFYWSGLLPASRYLSAQPLTGVPADAQYSNGERRSILEESSTAAARAQLIGDLKETQPKYIIDELGFFNGALAIMEYPELKEYMDSYKALGATGRFLVYIRRDLTRKNLLRKPAGQP